MVLKSEIDGHFPLAGVLRQLTETLQQVQARQELPFEQLVEALHPQRDLSHSPLFRVLMNHLRIDDRALQQLPALSLEEFWIGKQAAQFELALDTVESADGRVMARFTYASALFEPATIARLAEHYVRTLEHVALRPHLRVRDIELLSEGERLRLEEWGENPTTYEEAVFIHHLVEQQVEENTSCAAVVFKDDALSYADLNVKANRLAHHLLALGVTPEARVGVAMERSIELVVALLGILKAGVAYVAAGSGVTQ